MAEALVGQDLCHLLLHQRNSEPLARVVECEGLVLANLCTAFDLSGTRILADLGHSKSTFCLLQNGQALGSHALLCAGQHISQALAEDRNLSIEEAEELKCETGVLTSDSQQPPPRVATVINRIGDEGAKRLA